MKVAEKYFHSCGNINGTAHVYLILYDLEQSSLKISFYWESIFSIRHVCKR